MRSRTGACDGGWDCRLEGEAGAAPAEGAASGAEDGKSAEDDPMKALEESMKKDAAGAKKP